ncbi:hypothetical protein ACNOYE_32620 [Nannocystaceae bacterium ST9]
MSTVRRRLPRSCLLPLTLVLACSDSTGDDEVGESSGIETTQTGSDAPEGESADSVDTTVTQTDSGTETTATDSGTGTTATDSGTETTATDSGTETTATDSGTDSTDSTTGEPLTPCEEAEANKSSVGCVYYAIDANNDPIENFDTQPYAVVVSNVSGMAANVEVQTRNGGVWTTVASQAVAPGTLYQFDLADRHINYTGVNVAGAYKIVSDVPIIAYQFQPVNGQTSFTSDASLLLPSSVYDQYYWAVGWGEPSYGNAQINIVAAQDDTHVTIKSSTATVAGGGIPALQANVDYVYPNAMNEGDYLQIEANNQFTGTYITADKPIAVFSTHWCANVPIQNCCCDHLEEQVYGLQTWGKSYVASRLPIRNNGTPELTYWHLFAAENGTNVTFDAAVGVTGVPGAQVMNAGQVLLLQIGGTAQNPGDFVVEADKPIFMMQYMSSSANTNVAPAQAGDPAMTQGVPTEQFRDDYVLLIPSNWVNDRLVITKPANATITLDGAMIAPAMFTNIGTQGEWQVARVPAADGVHTLTGTAPFSVVVVGYDEYDSYAYPAGLDQVVINPQ